MRRCALGFPEPHSPPACTTETVEDLEESGLVESARAIDEEQVPTLPRPLLRERYSAAVVDLRAERVGHTTEDGQLLAATGQLAFDQPED
jgi:hypothetical protein